MAAAGSRSAPARLPHRPAEAATAPFTYALALGSNRRHGRWGAPAKVLSAALAALEGEGVTILTRSPTFTTPALGPAGRQFANAAALVETALPPLALLALLKRVERTFGRRRGQRWGARVVDLDILLWSGGAWRSPTLVIPHRELSRRRFVLDPLSRIAPDWRLPNGALAIRHLHHRLTRPRPAHRWGRTVGL